MTDKLTCGRLSTCELCSRCLLAEMLFKGRTVFYIYRYARSERIKQLAQKNQKW